MIDPDKVHRRIITVLMILLFSMLGFMAANTDRPLPTKNLTERTMRV